MSFSCQLVSDSLQPHGLSYTISWRLLKLMPIKSMMPSNHLILCHPLLFQPSIFPGIRVCANESVLRIRWPEYWRLSFNISPSNEHPGLIFFRMDWLDLLEIQGTLKSLLQHHSSKESILQCSAIFSQLCPTLCDPMNSSTPGLPVHHKLLEFTQTHVHCVGDAIPPFHPLSSPSPPALNLS